MDKAPSSKKHYERLRDKYFRAYYHDPKKPWTKNLAKRLAFNDIEWDLYHEIFDEWPNRSAKIFFFGKTRI